MFPVVCEFVLAGAIISKCVRTSSKCGTRSCSCRGIRLARSFLNIAVDFRCRFSSSLILPTSNLEVA